jgi:hypothetical protein
MVAIGRGDVLQHAPFGHAQAHDKGTEAYLLLSAAVMTQSKLSTIQCITISMDVTFLSKTDWDVGTA